MKVVQNIWPQDSKTKQKGESSFDFRQDFFAFKRIRDGPSKLNPLSHHVLSNYLLDPKL